MALDEDLAGFNINTSAASEVVLQEIMNMVWPQAFIVNNKLQPVLNRQLLVERVVDEREPADGRLQAEPEGRVVRRHADHR